MAAILDFQSAQFKNIHFVEDPKRNIQASFQLNQGCGIAMPDSYIEPAGQVDFPG